MGVGNGNNFRSLLQNACTVVFCGIALLGCGGGGSSANNIAPETDVGAVQNISFAPSTLPGSAVVPAIIVASFAPSRVTGVAPLSVFFDASTTTSSGTSRPFHDLEYQWSAVWSLHLWWRVSSASFGFGRTEAA